MSRIICLELNEVPNEIMIEFLPKIKRDNKADFIYSPTISNDRGHLHPWVTWSSVHRGVSHHVHEISDINQECSRQNDLYPTIMDELSNQGYRVGVFGSMHSGSVPISQHKKYSFFVPEAFAKHSECKPSTLNDFQKLNLSMSRKSARVVDKSIPRFKYLLGALKSYLKHAYHFRGLFCAFKQLAIEIPFPWTKTRRRILQSDILFDTYMSLLNKSNPDYSNFFTNHVASSMHRFWEAKFPNHYPTKISSEKWIKRYKYEIDEAMKSTIYYIKSLIKYAENNKDTQLWIISSMGQAAVKNYKKSEFFYEIDNMDNFLYSLVGFEVDFEQLPQMIPIYGLESSEETITLIEEKLKTISCNIDLKISSRTSKTIAFIFSKKPSKNIDGEPSFINSATNNRVKIEGIRKIHIDEDSGSSAYHVPQGILYRYGYSLPQLTKYYDHNGFLPIESLKELMIKVIQNKKI